MIVYLGSFSDLPCPRLKLVVEHWHASWPMSALRLLDPEADLPQPASCCRSAVCHERPSKASLLDPKSGIIRL
jgi:hypothetical protein